METKKEGVPIILPILSVLIFAAMYIYAAYGPVNGPEKTVEKFYASYQTGDYQGMAESVSVFWAVQYLPQYSTAKPSELMAERESIEKEAAAFFEQGAAEPNTDLKVEVQPEYTSEWENSAMVVYAGFNGEEPLGREMALLLKENDNYYLYMWFPLESDQVLEEARESFAAFDADYTRVLIEDTWM